MQKLILFVGALLLSVAAQAQADAKAGTVLGKKVYVLSEPTREFTIVDKVNYSAQKVLLTGETSIQSTVKQAINKGLKNVEKGKMKEFDGIMADDGTYIIYIKFKEDKQDKEE